MFKIGRVDKLLIQTHCSIGFPCYVFCSSIQSCLQLIEEEQVKSDLVGLLSPDQEWVVACGQCGPGELIASRRSSLTNASANVCLKRGKRTVSPIWSFSMLPCVSSPEQILFFFIHPVLISSSIPSLPCCPSIRRTSDAPPALFWLAGAAQIMGNLPCRRSPANITIFV